jgi:CHAD domain-containing protein
VPPLTAVLAATIAVRAGVSIARAARERRSLEQRECERRFARLPGEPLAQALQRMALGQLDIAIEALESAEQSSSPERAVHETRKALKRLGALLRLIEPQLGEEIFAREDAALKDSASLLSGARDADVLLATLDGLIARRPRKLEGRGGVLRLRAHLLGERERARRRTLGDPTLRAGVLAELRACRVRVRAWQLAEHDGIELVQPGLTRLYRQGRARYRRAAHGGGDRTRAMHRWRKRVKDLRYSAEMLVPAEERDNRHRAKGKRARRRRAQARRDVAWLGRVAHRADQLGEMLGDEHDLAVLDEYVRAQRRDGRLAGVRIGSRSRKTLRRLIAQRRRELRKRALREGERLFRRSPPKFVGRVRGAQRGAAGSVS